MTDKAFRVIFEEAAKDNGRDAFISDWALSSVWDDDPADLAAHADLCGRIWDLAHLSVKEIRASTGLSQVAFGQRFMIPTRSIENWESGARQCPAYTRLMLARLCKLNADSTAALYMEDYI